MKITLKIAILWGILSVALAQNVWAQDKVLSIPLPNKANSIKKPSSDLVKDGKILDVGEAAALAEAGQDISLLDPLENKMWQGQSYPATDAANRNYPEAQVGVKFTSFEAATKFTSMARVKSNANSEFSFRLALSRYSQPAMMRAALLRKLGYFIPSPKYYKNLKITFASEEEKNAFIETTELDIGVDFESRSWIIANNKQDHSITVSSATLEIMSPDYFDIHWGLAPNPEDPSQVALVQRFSRNRAYRSLIIPYALVDVPESVNRYSVKMASISTGFVNIPYFMADSFAACTYEDARWILRKLSKLTVADLKQVVQEGNYPGEIAELVLAKLVQRVKTTSAYFGLNSTLPNLPVDISTPGGLVVKGKVTREFVAGYPQRFAHGERTSPYQEGDFARYLGVDLKSSVIKNVTDRLNQRLQLYDMNDAVQKRQNTIRQRIIDHINTNPGVPLYQEVESWGGPLAGLNFNASRHIATGTYSGSTAPVQLVDNLSVGAGIGFFQTLDGLQNILPIGGANMSIVRDYTHVRPILSIKEGTKESWKNVMIPHFMKKLSKVLESEETKSSDGTLRKSLDSFLLDLRDGEVFTITDSMAVSAYIQASASLDVLLGITPFSFLNSVTLGADANRVILKQVSFVRVANNGFNGIHVYVREMKNKAHGLEFNTNFYINLLKIRAQNQSADILSHAFVVDYDPSLAVEVDPESEFGQEMDKTRGKLRQALLPLFRDNDTELLYANFSNKKFVVQHNLKAYETKQKFLAWKFGSFTEDHLLKIQYPRSEMNPDLDPKDEEVTLYSSKKGEIKGRDLLSLIFDFVDGIFANKNKNVSVSRSFGDNPANVPMGKAYWRTINTESDLTLNGEQYPSVAMIQRVWGGWSLKRDKFFKIIDEIEKEFGQTGVIKYPLINKNEFVNVKTLDFYRITANLSILDTGLDKVRDLMDDRNSKRFFDKIIRMIGNGDYDEGYVKYMKECLRARPSSQSRYGKDYFRGEEYDCLSRKMRRLIILARDFPKDKKQQTKALTEVIYILDDEVPMTGFMNFLGEENFIFVVRINGFRAGDEDGDLEYFSNTAGDPQKDYTYAGGLINLFVRKTGIMPTELDRTLGGYQ